MKTPVGKMREVAFSFYILKNESLLTTSILKFHAILTELVNNGKFCKFSMVVISQSDII